MTAEELMTEDVTTVDEDATVGDAIEVMEEKDVRHLPVVRGSEVVGMLSDRDLRGLGVSLVSDVESLERLQARLSSKVTALMSSDVITVEPSASVQEIVDLMLEEKISAVPVVDEDSNDLLGIVSYVDVLRAMRDVAE